MKNSIIQLLPNSWRILVILLRVYFDKGKRKNHYGSLRGVEKFTLEEGNEKNTKRKEVLKIILPTSQFFPGITLDTTHQNVQLDS